MYIDLVLTKERFENLGFSRVLAVDVIKPKIRKDIFKIKKNGLVIVEGGRFNREILSNRKVDVLLSPEKGIKKDSLHYRNSGLNHVLCNLARKNNIAIGISFNEILNSKKRDKLLGRIMQNIRLCRKYKVRMLLASFATNKYEMRLANDLISFAVCIGMHPKEAKGALSLANEFCKEHP